jgi:hypothetical protein
VTRHGHLSYDKGPKEIVMLRSERAETEKMSASELSKPSVGRKLAAEEAMKTLREDRSNRIASALSQANRKTGLFKK